VFSIVKLHVADDCLKKKGGSFSKLPPYK